MHDQAIWRSGPGRGDGRGECEDELEYRFEVVTGGDSGSKGRMNGVVWYSAGRP
jgi:hypothetical protein